MAGKYSEAEVLSKSLKGALEAVEGKGSGRTLLARKIYASSLLSLKREKLGEKAQQEVVESSTFAFGENHVNLAREIELCRPIEECRESGGSGTRDERG